MSQAGSKTSGYFPSRENLWALGIDMAILDFADVVEAEFVAILSWHSHRMVECQGIETIVEMIFGYSLHPPLHARAFPVRLSVYRKEVLTKFFDPEVFVVWGKPVHRSDVVHAGGNEALAICIDHLPNTVLSLDVYKTLFAKQVRNFLRLNSAAAKRFKTAWLVSVSSLTSSS